MRLLGRLLSSARSRNSARSSIRPSPAGLRLPDTPVASRSRPSSPCLSRSQRPAVQLPAVRAHPRHLLLPDPACRCSSGRRRCRNSRRPQGRDRVVTTSGIYGQITSLNDKSVQLQIADKVRIEVARAAVGGYQGRSRSCRNRARSVHDQEVFAESALTSRRTILVDALRDRRRSIRPRRATITGRSTPRLARRPSSCSSASTSRAACTWCCGSRPTTR